MFQTMEPGITYAAVWPQTTRYMVPNYVKSRPEVNLCWQALSVPSGVDKIALDCSKPCDQRGWQVTDTTLSTFFLCLKWGPCACLSGWDEQRGVISDCRHRLNVTCGPGNGNTRPRETLLLLSFLFPFPVEGPGPVRQEARTRQSWPLGR